MVSEYCFLKTIVKILAKDTAYASTLTSAGVTCCTSLGMFSKYVLPFSPFKIVENRGTGEKGKDSCTDPSLVS